MYCFCSVLGERTSKKRVWARENLQQWGEQPGFQCQLCLHSAPWPQTTHNLSLSGCTECASLSSSCLMGNERINPCFTYFTKLPCNFRKLRLTPLEMCYMMLGSSKCTEFPSYIYLNLYLEEKSTTSIFKL